MPNQQNMDGNQPVQSHSHAQQPLQPQTYEQDCPCETGIVSFPGGFDLIAYRSCLSKLA